MVLGIFDIFKKSRREINEGNQHQGKSGEEQIRQRYEFDGYKVERTGRGHDLKAKRQNWLTGKKETKYIEVKTGNSPLSKLQKKKKRQMGSKYVVERLEPTPFGFISKDPQKKRTSSKRNSFSFDVLFGSGNSSRSKKKKSSGYDAVFGTVSSNKRKKSSNYDTLFGSSSSSKRSKPKSTYDNMWGTRSSKKKSKKSDIGFW